MSNKTLTLLALVLTIASCSSNKKNADNLASKPKEVVQEAPKMFSVSKKDMETATTPQVVYFDTNSSKLTKDSIETLSKKVLEEAKKSNTKKVIIEAHCDERGSTAYNQKLSDKRALAVKNYLVKNGVNGVKIKTVGYGESKPVALGHNEESWSQNRRAVTVSIKR